MRISLSLGNYKKGWGRQKWITCSFFKWRRRESSRRSILLKEVKFQVRVWSWRIQCFACTVPEVYGHIYCWCTAALIARVRLHLLARFSRRKYGWSARFSRCTVYCQCIKCCTDPEEYWLCTAELIGTNFEVKYSLNLMLYVLCTDCNN